MVKEWLTSDTPMLFIEFAELCERLANISERSRKIRILVNALKGLRREYIKPFTLLIIGRYAPEWQAVTLEISWATIVKVSKTLFAIKIEELIKTLKKTGDIGETFRLLAEKRKTRRQLTLLSFQRKLTILDVYKELNKIAQISGPDSRQRKETRLIALLMSMSPLEIKYALKIIFGDMRHGVSVGLMEEAISYASGISLDLISRANMILGDLGEVAELALYEGVKAIKNVKIILFRPIRPMLAQKADNVLDALREHNFETSFEFKFDGLRSQIHIREDTIKIFSRRLKDITSSFPDLVKKIKQNIRCRECVLEGEIIGIKNGKPLPFQILMRRLRRISDAKRYLRMIPVKLYLFDVLYLDGNMLIDLPYHERRKILASIAGNLDLAPQLITRDANKAEEFLDLAIKSGHEGLVAKKLDSNYTPGIRGKKWLKIKRTLDPLDCVIVAAEWGYGRRKKWLSDYYLAVYDPANDKWLVIGKTFKGLTDKEFEELTKMLLKFRIYERGRTVYVQPKIVVEVIYDEIQKSPKYESGFALRFARINRIRWDKDPQDADTIEKVKKIYHEQFKYKAKLND